MLLQRDIEEILEKELSRQGWICASEHPGRNVYRQLPRTSEEQALLAGLRPDYCLYLSQESPTPEVIIEVKKPGMHLPRAKEQAMGYAERLGARIVALYDGRQTRTYWVDSAEELVHNGLPVQGLLPPEMYRHFVENGSNSYVDTPTAIRSKEDLIAVFAYANQKLRKAGITKGMERFFEFSNLLFLKLISENNDIVSDDIPLHVRWESYKHKTGEELLRYINDIVVPSLERIFNRQGQQTLFTPLTIRDTLALKQIIDRLDGLHLSGIKTDIKGDAFEYFIQQYNSSNNDLGEYFTPRHIVNFLVQLANPQYGERVYDPFCGTGGMLIAAFNHIKDSLQAQGYLTEQLLQDIKENTVYGSEISSNARITKMNMILTGDGHSNILQQDTLQHPVQGQYDVVITNIPFNLEGTAQALYSLRSPSGNSQSIQHVLNSLSEKPSARAFVIVPEAVLNNADLTLLRRHLVENNLLRQIISLPSGVFLPYTEAKASILVLQGYNAQPVETIRYTIIQDDGYTLTQRRRPITNRVNDLEAYLYDDSYSTREIPVGEVLSEKHCSLIWFKYFSEVDEGSVLLRDILVEEKVKNTELFPTATVSKHLFWGIQLGEDYWGEAFVSVTSETNEDYKVVGDRSFAYNPSRANTGSLALNLTGENLAVSKMYVTFRVDSPDFLPEYVYLCLRSQEVHQRICDRSFGSVRQSLRFEDLCTIAIPAIPLEQQVKMVQEVEDLYASYEKSRRALETFDVLERIATKGEEGMGQ
ncbi:MAG: hypothetical protein CSA97_03730 [Bacteroidetes bacterium]|nr:MAG: hypothetical protein CSA97_03730 [Bacteroidota bacterium]